MAAPELLGVDALICRSMRGSDAKVGEQTPRKRAVMRQKS
jgi:hypothetical protein